MTNNMEVRRNEHMNGIEVWFSRKPEIGVREEMHALGFRWSRAQYIWYTKYSELKLARTLAFQQRFQIGVVEGPDFPTATPSPAD